MPTDEQIAEFGKQMQKDAKQIVKTLKKLQKKAKQRKFTTELWDLAVNVAERKMKLNEAVEMLKLQIPIKFTCFVSAPRRVAIWWFHSQESARSLTLTRIEKYPSRDAPVILRSSGKRHEFYELIRYPDLEEKNYIKTSHEII